MAIIKAAQSGASLKHIINYVTQPKKTEEHLIAGVDCDPQNAYDDMMLTKELFHKTNGRQYKHFIYSFPPGEAITPEAGAGKRATSRDGNAGTARLSGPHRCAPGPETHPCPYRRQLRPY